MADNIIKVNVTATKKQSVNITAGQVQTPIGATADTSQYYSNLSKNWAVSESIVDGVDYSSKYYANKAKENAENAQGFESSTKESYNAFLEASANAVQEVHTTRDEAITNIENSKIEAVDSINSTKTTILNDIEFVADGEKQEIEELIDTGKDELKEAIGDVKVLTTLEIGDIGFTQMAIDETKGKRRVLNGQLIIQEQYVQFTNIIKNSVALNPDLACTEAEWQIELTMSANGVCYKYVIDDEAGTIRLPKYPDYLDLSINGAKTVSVYGTGMTLGLTNGSGTNVGIAVNNGNVGYLRQDNYGQTLPYTNSGTAGLSTGAAVGVTKDASKSGITGSVTTSSEQIKGTYFIQVATGAETEDNIINEIELNNPFSLLDYKYSEYELNNLSWLRSEGQYNYKSIYPAVYDLLLKIYNGVETKAGVSVKLTSETFTDYDFVLNTAEETFRLPIKVKQNFYDNIAPVVGNGKCLGLYDGTDTFGFAATTATEEFRGSVGLYGANVGTNAPAWLDGKNIGIGVTTDPSKSGIEAKLTNANLYLYFYVGETVQNANLVNIGRIQEHYTTKSMVDGQWVGTEQVRFYDGAMSVGTLSFDLSDYLPNDGYCYEVIVNLNFKGGSTTTALNISSGLISSIDMGQTANSSDYSRINAIIPIGTDRVLNMILAGAAATDVNLLLAGYRRIGTNL